MFLVTTADQRFWKTGEKKILFLGEWCRLYDQQQVWSRLDHAVLPYHWDDRERLYKDYLYLREVYERYLDRIAQALNDVHAVDRSLRYWRILVGVWLSYFIQILFDRYLSIRDCAESGMVTNTWISLPEPADATPPDTSTFEQWLLSDLYNHLLYSSIIVTVGTIPYEAKVYSGPAVLRPADGVDAGGVRERRLKRSAKSLFRAAYRFAPDSMKQIVLVGNKFSRSNLIRLQLSVGQLPFVRGPLRSSSWRIDSVRRARLLQNVGADPFELILTRLIAAHLPMAYLEGYAEMHARSLAAFPARPKVIATAEAHWSDDRFKFWAAHHVDSGAKFAVSQHGGHYGSGLWSSAEEHEIEISDRYYTWGWRVDGCAKVVPMYLPRNLRLPRSRRRADGPILWVMMSMPRYAYWMYSVPVGPQFLRYFDDQVRFLRGVAPTVHDLLLARLYRHDWGWRARARWRDIDSTLRLYGGGKSMEAQLKESRLMIATYNATSFLQTLVADFPTVMFWDPRFWELRPAAQPLFDELRRVGVLHDTPESAAATVNKIYRDPEGWWQSRDIQRARSHFCRDFARTTATPLREWREELRSLAYSSEGAEP